MNQRIEFIDVARGIAMLIVIFGHCYITEQVLLNKFILSFHMALFFMVSGMFIRPLERKKMLIGGGKKARAILIPQIIVVLLASIRPLSRHFIQGEKINYFFQFSFFSAWFLPVLFFCVAAFLIVGCLINLDKTRNKLICLIVALLIVPFSIDANKYGFTGLLHCLLIFPVAFTFYMLGNILKEHILRLEHFHNNWTGILAIVSICLCTLIAYLNSPVDFYSNNYGNLVLFYTGALLGCFSLLYFASFLTTSKFCIYVGKNSIAFYVWNFLFPWLSINIARPVLTLLNADNPNVLACLSFAIALPIFYVTVRITMKYIPWVYGIIKR